MWTTFTQPTDNQMSIKKHHGIFFHKPTGYFITNPKIENKSDEPITISPTVPTKYTRLPRYNLFPIAVATIYQVLTTKY